MSIAPTHQRGASFSRNRAVRTATGVATAGLMVGISLTGASAANAATDADCTVGNTVDAGTGTAANIQTLFDAFTPIVCLSGTFVLADSLKYNYDLTIHGLTDAVLDGGGLTQLLEETDPASLTVENMRFTNGVGSLGGAIRASMIVVHNSQFDNNSADFGGAINGEDIEIFDSLFFANDADYIGGAVMGYGSVSATRSTFRNNSAEYGGAIGAYGVITSDASTFEENTADSGGGAIANEDTVDVQNSTFVRNSAGTDIGGAIVTGGGSVRHSTFLGNTAVPAGGQSIATDGGTLEVRGSIFAGSDPYPHLRTGVGTINDGGGNVFNTTQVAENNLSSVQPSTQFGLTTLAIFAGADLASNGGPTQTVALTTGSPALQAVPASPESMTVDQRGVPRSAVSDAGAFEFTPFDGGSGDGAELANTGSDSAGWLGGFAALLFGVGATVLGLARRKTSRAL